MIKGWEQRLNEQVIKQGSTIIDFIKEELILEYAEKFKIQDTKEDYKMYYGIGMNREREHFTIHQWDKWIKEKEG